MVTRRKFFIKTKHKRRRHPPLAVHRDAEEASLPGVAREAPPPPAARPGKSWLDHAKSAGKLIAATLFVGYGIYFLATAKAGRSIYPAQSANPPLALPSYPGHRSAAGSPQQAGVVVEHSLADRPPPTDQSFRDTFGGARSGGGARSSGGGSAGETGELPDKVRLREDLAGNCEVGSNGRFDIENCLRRHSAPGR